MRRIRPTLSSQTDPLRGKEMEDEAMATLNGMNPFQYNSIRLQRLLNIQPGSLGTLVLAALRGTSFLRYPVNAETQNVCQHLMLTGIDSSLLHFNLENIRRCTSFIVVSMFCLWCLNEVTEGEGQISAASSEDRCVGCAGIFSD